MSKKLDTGDHCRCNRWLECDARDCIHREPHLFEVYYRPCKISFCRHVGELVSCLSLYDTIYDEEKDPNSVWRARKELKGDFLELNDLLQDPHNEEEQ